MPNEQRSAEQKLRLLGEKLRAGAAKIRPVPKDVIEKALKPSKGQEQDRSQTKQSIKRRRRRGPSL
jgi:transcriptional/translational regulatory protein YebC/TACO1